jgi:hypothetical protein
MFTLGNTDAALTSLNGLVQLQGPVAALARRLVYGVRMPTGAQRATALFQVHICICMYIYMYIHIYR